MKHSTITLLIAGLLIAILTLIAGCKKEEPKNVYLSIPTPVQNQNPTVDNLPVGSFAWLHAKVFQPTCANSGCHDGSFEPDFRSVGSAYNTLVNHPVISNDLLGTYTYRVVPGNVDASFLHTRLTTFVPNTSGIMPLVTNGTDWPQNGSYYKQKIAEWISSGAKDIFGNPAPSANVNAPPLVYGLVVFPHNNTTNPFPRETNSPYGIGAIEVPAGLVDVWILPYDDNAGVNQFVSAQLKLSANVNNFTSATAYPFALNSPVTAFDLGNNPNQFYYKATLDLSGYSAGTYYLRTYLDDGVQPFLTEVPNAGSNPFWFLIFSIKVL